MIFTTAQQEDLGAVLKCPIILLSQRKKKKSPEL